MERTHLGHIEVLRAFAAMMVLLFHFISFQDANGPLIQNNPIRQYSEFGAQGVELFYVISGFVIYYSLSNLSFGFKQYPKYVLKRVSRIIPPFWGVIFLICITPFVWKWPFPYTFSQIVQNMTLTVDVFRNSEWMNPIFVTLKVEFLFYLLIGLFIIPMRLSKWSYGIIVAVCLVGTYFFHSIDFVHNIPFFLTGIACSEIYKRREVILNYCLVAACLVFLVLVFPLEDVIITLIGIVFLLWIPLKNRWLGKVGQFSYSLYLTHGFSGSMFLFYCKNQRHVDWNAWVYIALAFTGSIIFAYCYYLVIEKRAISWSKGIRY